jgi:hypothetical protein
MALSNYGRVMPSVKLWSGNYPVQKTETNVSIGMLIKTILRLEDEISGENLWSNS